MAEDLYQNNTEMLKNKNHNIILLSNTIKEVFDNKGGRVAIFSSTC